MPVAAWLRRVPFTITLTLVILGLAVATGALWDPLAARPLGSWAYGLPAFDDGRAWTVVTGSLLAMQPAQYIPILLGCLVFGGFAEYLLGTRKAALAIVVCQGRHRRHCSPAFSPSRPRLPVGHRSRPTG
jgi:hypothetical protein